MFNAYRRLSLVLGAALGSSCGMASAAPAESEAWEPARTWVVVAGVLEWQNPGFAPFSKANRKDQELYDTLLARGVPAKNATLLLDERATRSAILDAVRAAAKQVDEKGTLIFYYAGHGVRRDDGYFLANYDAADDPQKTCVPVTELAKILKAEFRGRRVLFFADCCHSGGLQEAAKVVAAMKKQAGVLTSVAPEGISTGNWTFTETLLDGFKGRYTADRNADGRVTFQELADDVRDAMKHVERQPCGFANFGLPDGFRLSESKGPKPLPAGSEYKLGEFVTARDATGWVNGRLIGRDGIHWLIELQSYSTRPVLRVLDEDVDHIDAAGEEPAASDDSPAFAEIPLVAGTDVLVEWGGRMWPSTIREHNEKTDEFHVHYLGWADSYDEWVAAKRVVPLETRLEPFDMLAEQHGLWWPARVLAKRKTRSYVRYIGWSSAWDEWVGPKRIQKLAEEK